LGKDGENARLEITEKTGMARMRVSQKPGHILITTTINSSEETFS
jgi:hypothetical protein